jgi:hypothetical protein
VPIFLELESYGEIIEEILPPALMAVFILVTFKLFLYILQPVFKRALSRYLYSSYDGKQTSQFIIKHQ